MIHKIYAHVCKILKMRSTQSLRESTTQKVLYHFFFFFFHTYTLDKKKRGKKYEIYTRTRHPAGKKKGSLCLSV